MEYPRNDELLSAYLDRELSPDERSAMDRLLEKTPEARERLRELEGTSRFVKRLAQHGLDVDFADGVIERLRNEALLRPAPVEPVRRSSRFSWRISAPLAAAAALLIAVWMSRKPEELAPKTIVPGPLAARHAADSRYAADTGHAAVDRWEQLKVGDFFDLVGPEGESPFRLIVVGKESDTDPLRCFLVDKSDRDEGPPETSLGGEVAAASEPDALVLSLQADRAQLAALEQAYVQANSVATEPFPVVDIFARADGLVVGDVRAHSHFRGSAPSPAVHDQEPSEEAKALSSTIAAAGTRTRAARSSDGVAPLGSQGLPESTPLEPGSSSEKKRVLPDKTDKAESDKQLAKDDTLAASSLPNTVQSERNRQRFIIESVQVQAVAAAGDSTTKKTSESVRDMLQTNRDRTARSTGAKGKELPTRVEVLLRFKDNPEPEKSRP